MRRLSSGPWQVKQLSDRIGRTSRSKSTGLSAAKDTPARTSHINRRTDKVPLRCRYHFELFGAGVLGGLAIAASDAGMTEPRSSGSVRHARAAGMFHRF